MLSFPPIKNQSYDVKRKPQFTYLYDIRGMGHLNLPMKKDPMKSINLRTKSSIDFSIIITFEISKNI
jgi:hypothetical protein